MSIPDMYMSLFGHQRLWNRGFGCRFGGHEPPFKGVVPKDFFSIGA